MISASPILIDKCFAEQVYSCPKEIPLKLEHREVDWATSIREGDINVFESVFKSYYKPMCLYAQAILKDRDYSEEIVQQIFVKLWERRSLLNISTSVKAYLFQIVRNDCLNVLKHEKVKEQYRRFKVIDMHQQHDHASHRVNVSELEQHIQKAIDELPEQCSIIFRMSRFEEMKYKDIATQLNISVKTVENQMGKALKLMRTKLADFLTVILTLIFLHF